MSIYTQQPYTSRPVGAHKNKAEGPHYHVHHAKIKKNNKAKQLQLSTKLNEIVKEPAMHTQNQTLEREMITIKTELEISAMAKEQGRKPDAA